MTDDMIQPITSKPLIRATTYQGLIGKITDKGSSSISVAGLTEFHHKPYFFKTAVSSDISRLASSCSNSSSIRRKWAGSRMPGWVAHIIFIDAVDVRLHTS